MAFTMRVHERDKRQSNVIIKTTPYVRLSHKYDPALFFQKGHFYYEDGTLVKDVPDWAWDALDNHSAKVKQEIGYEGRPVVEDKPEVVHTSKKRASKKGTSKSSNTEEVNDGNDQPSGRVGQ